MNNIVQKRFDRSIREAVKATGQRPHRRCEPMPQYVPLPTDVRAEKWDNPVPMHCDFSACRDTAEIIHLRDETVIAFRCRWHAYASPPRDNWYEMLMEFAS